MKFYLKQLWKGLVLSGALVFSACSSVPSPSPEVALEPVKPQLGKVVRTILSPDRNADIRELEKTFPAQPESSNLYVSDASGLVRYSYRRAKDDEVNLRVHELLRIYSPEEARLFADPAVPEDVRALQGLNGWINMLKYSVDREALILKPNPDFDPVEGLVTWVHEEYHGWIANRLNQPARFFLDKDRIFTLPWLTTPPARASAGLLPPDLKNGHGSRIEPYIDPDEGAASRQVCQVHGLNGLLNEYTAYFHSARTAADLLSFYLDSQNFDFPGVKRLFSQAQNELTAQTEFRLFLLNYLLSIRTSDPGLYAQLRALEPHKDLVAELGRRTPDIMDRLLSQVQAVLDLYGEPRLQEEWKRKDDWFGSYRSAVEVQTARPELAEIRREWGL